jgi:hypothetical protein
MYTFKYNETKTKVALKEKEKEKEVGRSRYHKDNLYLGISTIENGKPPPNEY